MRPAALLLVPMLLGVLAACSSREPEAPSPATAPAAIPTPAGGLSADSLSALDRYEAQARKLVATLSEAEPIDQTRVDEQADTLVAIASTMLPDFLRLQPHCRPYLDATLGLIERWRDLSADEIEAGYHKDGALPKVENGASCYHMKDLIVHPITAQALIAEGMDNRDQARREIDEVLAHLSVVRATR